MTHEVPAPGLAVGDELVHHCDADDQHEHVRDDVGEHAVVVPERSDEDVGQRHCQQRDDGEGAGDARPDPGVKHDTQPTDAPRAPQVVRVPAAWTMPAGFLDHERNGGGALRLRAREPAEGFTRWVLGTMSPIRAANRGGRSHASAART